MKELTADEVLLLAHALDIYDRELSVCLESDSYEHHIPPDAWKERQAIGALLDRWPALKKKMEWMRKETFSAPVGAYEDRENRETVDEGV